MSQQSGNFVFVQAVGLAGWCSYAIIRRCVAFCLVLPLVITLAVRPGSIPV